MGSSRHWKMPSLPHHKTMEYRRVITAAATRSLKRLSHDAQRALLEATMVLNVNPYAGERLHGPLSFFFSFHFKLDNIQYRAAYSVDVEKRLIIIHYVGPRENFYERLRRLFS